jgi:hypothetical protein
MEQPRTSTARLLAFFSSFWIALIVAGVSVAFAALTVAGTSITGDANTTLDATGTIIIGSSSATGITIGRSGITTTFPGMVTITGQATTTNLAVLGSLVDANGNKYVTSTSGVAVSSTNSILYVAAASSSAVSRTLTTKLGDTISVKDFGATCNGVTNDAVAIQNAINAANGQTVYFPACAQPYYIGTTTLSFTGNYLSLDGDGQGATDIKYTGTSSAISIGTYGTASNWHQIRNMEIDLSSAGANAVGITLTRTFWDTIENVDVNTFNGGSNNGQIGLVLNGGGNFGSFGILQNVAVNGCFEYGIEFTGDTYLHSYTATDIIGGSLVNNCATKTGTIGLYMQNGDTDRASGLDIEDFDIGAFIGRVSNILGIRFEGNSTYDWETTATSTDNSFWGSTFGNYNDLGVNNAFSANNPGASQAQLVNLTAADGLTVSGAAGTQLNAQIGIAAAPSTTPDIILKRNFAGSATFTTSAGNAATLNVEAGTGQSTNDLTTWENSSGIAISAIDPNGNLGIGTAAPSTTLQVAGASSTIRIGTSALPGCLEMGNSNGSGGINYVTFLNGVMSATTTKPSACQ